MINEDEWLEADLNSRKKLAHGLSLEICKSFWSWFPDLKNGTNLLFAVFFSCIPHWNKSIELQWNISIFYCFVFKAIWDYIVKKIMQFLEWLLKYWIWGTNYNYLHRMNGRPSGFMMCSLKSMQQTVLSFKVDKIYFMYFRHGLTYFLFWLKLHILTKGFCRVKPLTLRMPVCYSTLPTWVHWDMNEK